MHSHTEQYFVKYLALTAYSNLATLKDELLVWGFAYIQSFSIQ